MRIEDETRKLITIYLPYVKGLAERPKGYVVHMTSGQYSPEAQVSGVIPSVPIHQQNLTWPRTVCIPSLVVVVKYIYRWDMLPLKIRLEEHRKAVVRGEIEKSGMADYIWNEKGNHLPLWDEIKIIDREEHWRIRRLIESAHMLGYSDPLSRLSIEMNTIWEPIIKTVSFFLKRNMSWGKKKLYIVAVIIVI